MSYAYPGLHVPDPLLCRYGTSRLDCRGPKRRLRSPYLAFLGGSETFGRYVPEPFPSRVEAALGLPCVNLGVVHAGLDAFLGDSDLLALAAGAQVAVVQVFGLHAMSNPFFRVHPRRNDRFLAPSDQLRAVFPEVDFTAIHFNRHLLGSLLAVDALRLSAVRLELRQAWLEHMHLLLDSIGGSVVLLWLAFEAEPSNRRLGGLGPEPLLIDEDLVAALRPRVQGVVRVPVTRAGRAGDLDGMQYGQLDVVQAEHALGPGMHHRVAQHLVRALRDLA